MTNYLNYQVDFNSPEFASSFNELTFWSSRFGALLVDNIDIVKNASILDIGCATGFPLFEIAQLFGNSCELIGIDIWKEAIVIANNKLKSLQLSNVNLILADGAKMPFQNDKFDLIVSNLGINNFTDPKTVLLECYRVSKPNGKVVFTTNIKGHMQEFYNIFRQVLVELNKTEYLSKLASQENHRGTEQSICDQLKETGFTIVKMVKEEFKMRFQDGSALLNHSLTKVGFLEGWRSVLKSNDELIIFENIEKHLNEIAKLNDHLTLTIHMLYIEGQSNK